MSENVNKSKEQKEYSAYIVTSLPLAHRIIDAGYLFKLRDVKPNKYKKGRVYFFSRDEEIGKIIEKYRQEKRIERQLDKILK